MKHLKILKTRYDLSLLVLAHTSIIYDADHVCICNLVKQNNFLQFEFVGFGVERDHLHERTEMDREKLVANVLAMKEDGKSYREIACEIGISHTSVAKIINNSKKV